MGIQSGRSPNFRNFETPDLGVQGKMTFGLTFVASHRKYYKGEGGGFPQVQVMAQFVRAPKVL
jgi:hypothetical protein